MIQIQGRQQLTNAAARIQKERVAVRRYEAGAYLIGNKTKGHSYFVRFSRDAALPLPLRDSLTGRARATSEIN